MVFSEVVTVAAAVVGFLVLVGGAIALVRGSYDKARIQALREDNADLRARIDDTDKEAVSLRTRLSNVELELEHRKQENLMLVQMVTQRAEVDEVKSNLDKVMIIVDDHSKAAESHWTEVLDALQRLESKAS